MVCGVMMLAPARPDRPNQKTRQAKNVEKEKKGENTIEIPA